MRVTVWESYAIRLATLLAVIPSDSEGSCHRQAYETGAEIQGIRVASSRGSLLRRWLLRTATLLRMTAVLL